MTCHDATSEWVGRWALLLGSYTASLQVPVRGCRVPEWLSRHLVLMSRPPMGNCCCGPWRSDGDSDDSFQNTRATQLLSAPNLNWLVSRPTGFSLERTLLWMSSGKITCHSVGWRVSAPPNHNLPAPNALALQYLMKLSR